MLAIARFRSKTRNRAEGSSDSANQLTFGKQMAVSELKAGMKGTATVTTTTTIKPVVVTEVREGEVLRASGMSVTVRQADGTRRYTQGELDAKGVQIIKDGRPIHVTS